MDVNKVIDVIDNITFIEEENTKGISMVYFNYDEISWYGAKTFANGFRALEYKDWRLPTVDEMKYLIEKSYMKKYGKGGWVWCDEYCEDIAYNIHIIRGLVDEDIKSMQLYVMLVR